MLEKGARMLAGKLIATVGMIAYVAVTLQAQWQVTTKRVPMTPDGKPNYGAPAPEDGGWENPRPFRDLGRGATALHRGSVSVWMFSDALSGIPVGFINITTGAAEDHHRCSRGPRLW